MKQALIEEERIEIQGFAVIEVKRSEVKQTVLNGKQTSGKRRRWVIKVSQNLVKSDCFIPSTKA
jgi:hypothetical protein